MKKISLLSSLVKPYYNHSDPAHDWAHILRVAKTATFLAEKTKANVVCTLAATFCHDLVNLPKSHPDRKNASVLSAQKATPLLKEVGFLPEEIEVITTAIIEHSYSRGMKPTSVEAKILQDADRLDALGAIGVLRCASVNTQMKSLFYESSDPLANNRELDDKSFMLDHYFVKLFKLPDLMNTKAGREIAQQRVQFMKNFINVLSDEIL